MRNHPFVKNLERQASENPIAALGVGAVFLKGLSALMNANTSRQNSKAWAREVDRRERNSRRK